MAACAPGYREVMSFGARFDGSIALALLVVGTVGLGGCEGDEPSIDGLARSVGAEINAQIDALCGGCSTELGYADPQTCAEDFGQIGPNRERCTIDAYDRDRETSHRYLECIEPLQQAYTACITDRLDCADPESTQPCADQYDQGRQSCVQLPATIEDALDDCFGDTAP